MENNDKAEKEGGDMVFHCFLEWKQAKTKLFGLLMPEISSRTWEFLHNPHFGKGIAPTVPIFCFYTYDHSLLYIGPLLLEGHFLLTYLCEYYLYSPAKRHCDSLADSIQPLQATQSFGARGQTPDCAQIQ